MPQERDELITYFEGIIASLNKELNQKSSMLESQQQILDSQKALVESQKDMIDKLQQTVASLEKTVLELNITLDQLRRKIFGSISEKSSAEENDAAGPEDPFLSEQSGDTRKQETLVKEHVRSSAEKKRSKRDELYKNVPVKTVRIPVPEAERLCGNCGGRMEHLGYKFDHEELQLIPAHLIRVRYEKETLVCRNCSDDEKTEITEGKAPQTLFAHSPASASFIAHVMTEKFASMTTFYRQELYWQHMGVPVPRENIANWCILSSEKYLSLIYEQLHAELLKRAVIHADEVPCQVLREEGRTARQKSYMWVYRSGSDGDPGIVLYEYQPGRKGEYAKEFLKGFTGYVQCDGYSGYNKLADVTLVICLAHCRRYFFNAIPASRRKQLQLLDVYSEKKPKNTETEKAAGSVIEKTPGETGFDYCNQLFMLERTYHGLRAEERKQRRLEEQPAIWEAFWKWLETLDPANGSALAKAVTYAVNHNQGLMNYMEDGRCEISNNAAERMCKSYVMGRKNFLFHTGVRGAAASAIIYSLIESAKANGLNPFQYLYMLLLYIPDYQNEPEGIKMLMPWSDFIKERCTGMSDVETIRPDNKGKLPLKLAISKQG